jgi:uncharacterized protein (TIGR00369 family)
MGWIFYINTEGNEIYVSGGIGKPGGRHGMGYNAPEAGSRPDGSQPQEDRLDKQPTSRFCFLCGRDNPVGLKMSWVNDQEKQEIVGTVTVPEHFNGYPGAVHGGIVATILDETAGRAILLNGSHHNLMVTLKLEVTYKKPTPTATPLTAVGRVVTESTRRARVEGELKTPDGTVTAVCKAIIVRPPEEMISSWEEEKAYWRVD